VLVCNLLIFYKPLLLKGLDLQTQYEISMITELNDFN